VASKFSLVEEAGPLFGRDFKRTARGPTLFGEHCYEPPQCLIGPLYFRCAWWQCGTPGFAAVLERTSPET
jgi:hypothetical protein